MQGQKKISNCEQWKCYICMSSKTRYTRSNSYYVLNCDLMMLIQNATMLFMGWTDLRERNSDVESGRELFKGSKDVASLLVCTRKKIFGWRMRIFCEWRHKWRTYGPPWPTSPGPGPKPLDGSILLKFLLETRRQSESFDTSDDLLGFRVQKLWSKVSKICLIG